jgi:nitroimidazol reductase NimA-like FMN-containing flavoprotein (pyridoxamine 5'-phosphate oxidase superfamily)
MPKRGAYDRASVHAILDEGLICHVGFVHAGSPVVIPTGYGRDGDVLYLHGSVASRMLRTLAEGVDMSVTVTLLDGLVLARSAFNHSMNYRSVVVFGRARLVEDPESKLAALYCLSEHLVPGRWNAVRPPTERELKGTSVLALPLDEASAKIRSGPPEDDDEDYALPHWAGVLPFTLHVGPALADPRLAPGIAVPEHVSDYRRPHGSSTPAAGT